MLMTHQRRLINNAKHRVRRYALYFVKVVLDRTGIHCGMKDSEIRRLEIAVRIPTDQMEKTLTHTIADDMDTRRRLDHITYP